MQTHRLGKSAQLPFAQNYRHYDVDRIKPSMYTRGIKRRKQVSVMRDDRDNVARVQRADARTSRLTPST